MTETLRDSILESRPPLVPPDAPRAFYAELHTDLMFLNMGPAHPATHGTLRTFMALDGETVAAAVLETGYLHRGFEKTCEHRTYNQAIPYSDRLNYCSAIMNNVGLAKAVEKLMGVEITERCAFLRVIVSELMRIVDHCVCFATNLLDIGAGSNFWYLYNKREQVYTLLERLTGARLTNSFTRIGGLARDAYEGFEDDVLHVLNEIEEAVRQVDVLNRKNRILIDRTKDICIVKPEQAIAWGWTGPCARASGVDFDLRRDQPYYFYDQFEWEVVLGTTGDTYDRIMLRLLEIEQSIKIIRQAIKHLPGGPVNVDDKRVTLPGKVDTYQNIEGLINHFKLIFEGVKAPVGEVYDATEAANGELGFYIVSDGSGYPYKLHCRAACLPIYAKFNEIIEGHMIADAVATLGCLNIIAGELER